MSFKIETPDTFPYQIQPSVDSWRLIDVRDYTIIEERSRTPGLHSQIIYAELLEKARELAAEYRKAA